MRNLAVLPLLMISLVGCMTSAPRRDGAMPAHPTVPVQAAAISAPAPQADTQVADMEAVPAPVTPDTSGPVQLHTEAAVQGSATQALAPPTSTEAVQPAQPATTQSTVYRVTADNDRWEFLNWFGANNAAQRAPSPTVQLRQSRDVGARQGATDTHGAASQYPVMIGENSRLVPTYTDALPVPPGQQPLPPPQSASASDEIITGSIAPAQPTAAVSTNVSAAEVVQTSAPVGALSRTEPSVLRFAPGQTTLDAAQRAELDRIAAAYRSASGKIHLYGISRGAPGDRNVSTARVRRLMSETAAAARYLATQGIATNQVVMRTSEETVPGRYFGSDNPRDQDRIEVFIE
jgi:outer membrane protein OmpA-like peptidoglycan-associated protein